MNVLQQAGDVEEGGLARARRAGDGDELALAHVEVEAAQRVGLDHVGAVDLAQVLHAKHCVRSLLGGHWLIETRSASSKASVPAITTLSPAFRPARISTAETLVAPSGSGGARRRRRPRRRRAAAAGLDERAARHHQHVRLLLDQQRARSRAGSGAGRPAARRRSARARAPGCAPLPATAPTACPWPCVAGRDFGAHAEAEVVGVALRDLELDLERRQVDERHQRRVGGDDGCGRRPRGCRRRRRPARAP